MPHARYGRCAMIVAGEASGDLHGARLVRSMRQRDERLFFCGIGGKSMAAEGVRILFDAHRLSVVGITEVMSRLPDIIRGMSIAGSALKTLRPDLLILIDFPDFNLHLAAHARKLGIPVLYYIGPQVWAWRPGRVRTLKKRVDHMAVILPFEAEFYQSHGIRATFVGHPLLDSGLSCQDAPVLHARQQAVGLLPGSRHTEIIRHLPLMLDAARRLNHRIPGIRFIVSRASTAESFQVEELVRPYASEIDVRIVSGSVENVLQDVRLAVAVSGTVTLEAALCRTPTIIVYRVSPLSYRLGKALIRVPYIGLANLIAGKTVSPELIQDAATAENIADLAAEKLADLTTLEAESTALGRIQERLGGSGASDRTAQIALDMLASGKKRLQ